MSKDVQPPLPAAKIEPVSLSIETLDGKTHKHESANVMVALQHARVISSQGFHIPEGKHYRFYGAHQVASVLVKDIADRLPQKPTTPTE